MTNPIGLQPLKHFTGMTAGTYRYRSNPEDPGVMVRFTYVEGIPTATILEGEDEGLELDEREMGGEFNREENL